MWVRVIGALLVVSGLASPAVGQTKEDRDFVSAERGRAIADWMKEASGRGFSGAVIAADHGKVVAAIGVGFTDEAQEQPITPATLFEIASLSKQVTAAAALRLVDLRRLELDDPIAEHLPDVPESCAEITTRHLLQNTSGIPGSNSRGHGEDLAAVLPLFLEGGPVHPPGTHWEYWNQGFALATEVIARRAKVSFVDFCRKELFRPAKMKSTGFTGDDAPRGASVAVGRTRGEGKPRGAFDHPYGDSFGFQYRGMGGVVSNVWDLWRWDRALAGKLLKKDSVEALLTPGLNDYSLGWFVRNERGRLVQSHGGSVRGFVCEGRRYPEQDACVFVLSNDDGADVRAVATAVEQLLFGEETSITYPDPQDALDAEFLAGQYQSLDGDLKIWIVESAIRAQVDWKSGETSRMTVGRDATGAFAVFVNEDRYDLGIEKGPDEKAARLELWGRSFRRVDS